MRTELRHNKNYLFLVDKDSVAEIGDYITDSYNIWKWEDDSSLLGRKKVIAYRKLNEQAPDLDLPVLPNPFEVNVPDSEYEEGMFGYTEIEVRIAQNAFKEGYKAATKQFSLEDMKKAIRIAKQSMGVDNCGERCYSNKSNEEIIQSLSTQQLPVGFEPEYEKRPVCKACNKQGYRHCAHPEECGSWVEMNFIKTITNSEGKEVLIGEYKY